MQSVLTPFWSLRAGPIRRGLVPTGLCLAAVLTAGSASAVPLFDGTTFAGWEGDTDGVWRIADGEIVAGSLEKKQPKNDFLCTTRRYGNFELRLKIKLAGTEGFVNSGIQFRSERIPGSHEVIGYQADFGHGYDGALYDESRRKRMLAQPSPDVLQKVSRPGEWHDYRIRAEGPRVQLWVNGIQTVDYTLAAGMVPDLRAGLFQRSASAMEAVADHYQIPTVHVGVEVARRLADGTLIFKGEKPEGFDPAAQPMLFSTDGVHPLVETGHRLYAEVLARSLEQLEQAGGDAGTHEMPAPLRVDHWEQAGLVPITAAMVSGGWQRVGPEDDPLAKRFGNRMPVLWRADAAGATLRFRVRIPDVAGVPGRQVAVYDLIGPGGGLVSVCVDDGPAKQVARIDGYCTYWRIATLSLGLLPAGEHEVTVTLTGESPKKREILFERNRGDLEKHPEKYAPNQWYASALLIFGEAGSAGETIAP